MGSSVRTLITCAGVLLSQAVLAQMQVDMPDVAVGDTWVYRTVNRQTGVESEASRQQVLAVNADRITVGANSEAVRTYTRNWAQLTTKMRDAMAFSSVPGWQGYKFPMRVGDTWDSKTTNTFSSGFVDRRTGTVKVVGVERVTVPAGSFDTLKLQTELYSNGQKDTGSWTARHTSTTWYSPAAKRAVKIEATDHSTGVGWVYHHETKTELMSFTPGAADTNKESVQ